MQRIALILFFTTVMTSESLCAQVSGMGSSRVVGVEDDAGYPLRGDVGIMESNGGLQQAGGGNPEPSDELMLTPLLLRKLLLISRLQQSENKRSHYKQCAFNAVSCFG